MVVTRGQSKIEMEMDGHSDLSNFLKRGLDKSFLSQIIVPFCSNANESVAPVALLSGNINLKTSLKKNGVNVSLEDQLQKMVEKPQNQTGKGIIIDLSSEMKKLDLEIGGEKEVEIKEDWSESDILQFKNRTSRYMKDVKSVASVNHSNKEQELSLDIDELLRLAELEEAEDEMRLLKLNRSSSKLQSIKNEIKKTEVKTNFKSLNLPKISATNPLIGEVIERTSDPVLVAGKNTNIVQVDQVSNRIILNDLKKVDLRSSFTDSVDEKDSSQLKRSSLFRQRKE